MPVPTLFALLGGCSEYAIQNPNPHVDQPILNHDLPEEWHTHVEKQNELIEPDVLFVIDNSCSMADDQITLALNFPSYHDVYKAADADFQLGATSTDMYNPFHQGRLLPAGDGVTFAITRDTPNADSLFGTMVSLGSGGSSTEQGLDAAYLGAVMYGEDDIAYTHNMDFFRPQAGLSLVFVSDEADYSYTLSGPLGDAWSTNSTDLIAELDLLGLQKQYAREYNFNFLPNPLMTEAYVNSLSAEDRSEFEDKASQLVRANAIVSMASATAYLDVVNATGGIAWDLTKDDWQPDLQRLARNSLNLRDEFYLPHIPVEDSISVEVTFVNESGQEITWAGESLSGCADWWSYDQTRNSIRFLCDDALPPELSEVAVTYQLASSAGGAAR